MRCRRCRRHRGHSYRSLSSRRISSAAFYCRWGTKLGKIVLVRPCSSPLPLRASLPVLSTAAQDDREARYCEYRSQWTFPSSSPTLAIWTNSSSEHPRAHLSHCCFLPKSRMPPRQPTRSGHYVLLRLLLCRQCPCYLGRRFAADSRQGVYRCSSDFCMLRELLAR